MACLNMPVDSMIQNNKGNRVRGGRRGVDLRGVRGSGATFRGARQLDGHGRRAPLGLRGVRGLGGTFGGAKRSDGHGCRAPQGLRGVRGLGRTFGGAKQLDGQGCRAPLGLRGVRGLGGTFGGAKRLDGHGCRAPLGLRRVRGPQGTFGGARLLNGHLCRAPLGLRRVRGPQGTFGGVGRLDGPSCRGPLGLSGVRGPRGSFRGAGRLDRPPCGGAASMDAITKTVHETRNLPREDSVLEDRLKVVGSSGVESGTKLQVSNLNAGVSNEDLRGLFSEFGELIRYGIQYDKDGSPCGSAEVIFARGSDAFQAVKNFNNTDLKGKPMKIEKVGSTVKAHVASHLNMIGVANGRRTRLMPGPSYMRDASIRNHGAGPSRQRGCSGWNGGAPIRQKGHGIGRNPGGLEGRPVEKSAGE